MENFWQILVFILLFSNGVIVESSKLELIAPNVVKSGEDFRINCSVVLTDDEQQNAEVILKKDNNEFYRYNKRSKYSNDSIKKIFSILLNFKINLYIILNCCKTKELFFFFICNKS
jgi:hypothetical protein